MAKRKLPGQKVKSIRLPPTSPNEAQICKDEYPYQPLVDPKRHIRVLVLEPGRGSSVIIGHFLTRRLTIGKVQGNVKVEPAYEALSYSWGNAKETSTIRLAVGKPSGDRRRTLLYQVTVTKTLESCLKRLRNKSEARYLWVDSLCINQMDHDEKSVQVEAMGSIYRQAEQVCVWLGKTENGSKEAFDLIRQIIQIDGIGNAIENRDNTRRWRAFGALLRRKWFSRRWIVQEIALARSATVHCGADSMSWEDFSKGVAHYESRSEEILRHLMSHERQAQNATADSIEVQALGAHSLINTLQQLFRRGSSNEISEYLLPLDALMSMLTNFDVTNSKDVIYAIRTLAKDFQEPDWCGNGTSIIDAKKKGVLVPNYNQTTLDVYIEFIKYVIKTTKRLDIICIPWAPKLKGDEASNQLPSWITQISKRPFSQHDDENGYFSRDNADTLVGRADDRMYNVSGHMAAERWTVYRDERHHPRLVVRGRKIGDIGRLGDAAVKGWVPFSWLDIALEVERRRKTKMNLAALNQKATGYTFSSRSSRGSQLTDPTGKSSSRVTGPCRPRGKDDKAECRAAALEIPDSFWRTLVADRGPKGSDMSNPPSWYATICTDIFSKRRQFLKTDEKVSKALCNPKGIGKDTLEFLRRVQATTWNRKFMVTERDSIGLAPSEAKVGDMICMLWGCSVPVILRDLGGNKCQLIGECYVHGIMHGEFLEKHTGIEKLQDDLNREFDII